MDKSSTNADAIRVTGALVASASGSIATASANTPIIMPRANDLYYLASNQHVYELYNWSGNRGQTGRFLIF